jgi:4-hydroxybenzoyl-CoA thioesterase
MEMNLPLLSNKRTVRIEWADCDPAGIVFYPRYFEMFDTSTVLLFETALGMRKKEMYSAFAFGGWPVVDTRARFFKPTSYGDTVEIATSITFGTASFSIAHELTKDGETAVKADEKRVWVVTDPNDPLKFRSHPIPRDVIERFERG